MFLELEYSIFPGVGQGYAKVIRKTNLCVPRTELKKLDMIQ